MIGEKFGRWTVIGPFERFYPNKTQRASYSYKVWPSRCECGTERLVCGKLLRHGASRSCGCFMREVRSAAWTSHGMSRTRFYRIWHGMHRRCTDESYVGFHNYGGRRIRVCERWNEFENFLSDMLATYRNDLTLERIENNGNYEPDNCCWIPKADQVKNRRPPSEWKRRITCQ